MNCHRNKFFVCLLLAFGLHLSATCAQEGILDGLGDAAAENEAPARPNQANFPDFFGGQRQLSPEEQQQLQDQIQKLNTDAKAKEAAGDIDGAIAAYNESLAVASNFEAHYGKGRLLREQGYNEEAIQSFLQALGTMTALEDTNLILQNYLELGKAYLDTEQFNTAIAAFSTALSLQGQSRNPEVLFNLGLAQTEFALSQQFSPAQTRQEDLQKGLAYYDRAIKAQPDYPEALYERGSTHLLLGDLESAMEDLEKAVELDPTNPEAVAQLGFASLRRGLTESNRRNGQLAQIIEDLQLALAQFTQYLQLVPEPAKDLPEEELPEIRRENIYLQRSAANIGLGEETHGDRSRVYFQNAITDAEEAIRLQPELPDGYYQKGLSKRLLGDIDGAMDAWNETLTISPTNTETLLRRGILHYRRGDLELAKADLEKAVRFSGGFNARAYFWLGICHSNEGNPNRAITEYSRAIRFDPFFSLAYHNRGLSYMKIGRFTQATQDFNEVLRREPENTAVKALRDQALGLSDK